MMQLCKKQVKNVHGRHENDGSLTDSQNCKKAGGWTY